MLRIPIASRFRKTLAWVAAACCCLLSAYTYMRPPDFKLTLEMSATDSSVAQLFHDNGNGFREIDSQSIQLGSNSLQWFDRLAFSLPDAELFNLRFDPLTKEGRVVIRNIAIRNHHAVMLTIPVTAVKPLNQIASQVRRGAEVEFATTPGATDPSLTIDLARPLSLHALLAKQTVKQMLLVNGLLVAAFVALALLERALWYAYSLRTPAIGYLNRRFDALAEALSSGRFLPVDRLSIWVYLTLTVFFIVASALNLNGSSEGVFNRYARGGRAKIFLGQPLPVRSDEWAYHTPDVLNQYFRADRFAAKDSVLGNYFVALTGNIPVKDISTIFRPQFWPYFVLSADYAYSMYWQAKGFILTVGMFTFLLWITGSSGWALAGMLWYFFSAFTQWCYSWPSAMPEMVGLLCLGTVCFCYLTVGRRIWMLAIAALGTVTCGVDFALCSYLPHMIPLCWLGAAATIAWCIAARRDIFNSEMRSVRISFIALVIFGLAASGWHIYTELKPAILAVAQTTYPGQRVVPGGGLPLWWLGSHFLQWTETAEHFPPGLANICEGSGFIWLAPVTLLCLPRLSLTHFQKAALVSFWAVFLLLFCWGALPLPVGFGRLFGLDLCFHARLLPGLGLANVAIVVMSLARFRNKLPTAEWNLKRDTIYFLAGLGVFASMLAAVNTKLGGFFSWPEILFSSVFWGVLCVLIVTGRGRALGFSLVLSQAALFGLVNPVERGLPVYTKSELNRFVQSHRELLQGKWIVYSGTPVYSGFLASAGCFVYTGLRYVPDVDDFALFKSHGLDVNIVNNLAYLDAQPIPRGQASEFKIERFGIVDWKVAPSDPLLGQLGIRFVAFDAKPAENLTFGLQPLAGRAFDGFWLYRTIGKN